jgi:hypothetical protein
VVRHREEDVVLEHASHEMPELWRPGTCPLSQPGRRQELHDKEAPMPIMPIGLSVNSVRPGRPDGGEAAWRNRMEGAEGKRQAFRPETNLTEADLIFRLDAADLGFLNRPRGMAAYYRAFGMLPPRYLTEDLPRIEYTNFDLSRLAGNSLRLTDRAS